MVAFRSGRIWPVAARGNLTEYRGSGYCYHSLLRPEGWHIEQCLDTIIVESKPKGTREPRLKDALLTLSKLPSDSDGFVRIPFPLRIRDTEADYDEALRYNQEIYRA